VRIAYILEWDISYDSGVFNKVLAQVKVWISNGHNVKIFAITQNRRNDKLESYIHQYSNNFSFLKSSLKTYINKILSIKKVEKDLNRFDPDIVYIRQPIWYPGIDKFLSQFTSIMELNTDDLNEIKLLPKVKQYIYLYGREKIINSVKGFVSVSYEIENLYKKYNKPIVTIANGYDISQIPKFEKTINERKQVIFVGSPNQAWHGVEKIIYLAKNLKEFDFHIVGPVLNLPQKLNNIKLHGYLAKKDLFELYKKIDVGIGTLSLYKNGMQEASPLKVREYIAFKLPVVLGYKDTDLDGQEYVLNIGNYKNNVKDNIEKIREFINNSEDLRKKINPSIISYEYKEKRKINFFEQIQN
jgi:hypothetical protein